MYKVRFHLARGKNYLKWQIRKGEEVWYYSPNEVSLIMHNCKLINKKSMATKIFNGANKNTCAWVRCEKLEIVAPVEDLRGSRVQYNPKKAPNWVLDSIDVDNTLLKCIISKGNQLYVISSSI